MYTFLIIITVILAILLIGIVLIQKSKGGGLSSQFGGGNQVMGVRKTTDFVEKATWTLAIAICLLSILSVFFIPKAAPDQSRVNAPATEQAAPAPANSEVPAPAAPAAPAPAPAPAPGK